MIGRVCPFHLKEFERIAIDCVGALQTTPLKTSMETSIVIRVLIALIQQQLGLWFSNALIDVYLIIDLTGSSLCG